MKKFIVFTSSYCEDLGGTIVLHKLCSILNELGYESYIYPYFETYTLNKHSFLMAFMGLIKSFLLPILKPYKTNPTFNTPIYKGRIDDLDDGWVVIYPEITFGNPLKAVNVVRWFLHQPGFHTGQVCYGKNELYYKFNSGIDEFNYPGSRTSEHFLKVIHYPLDYYNTDDVANNRKGTAYCLRKGINKPLQHDLQDSILIDGKSHKQVAKIFKKVTTFISYDTYTAYSIFAVLCGCDSIVIPDEGVPIDKWYPNPTDRYGISYGFEGVEQSRKTAHLVKEHIINEEKKSVENVIIFAEEVVNYFEKCNRTE